MSSQEPFAALKGPRYSDSCGARRSASPLAALKGLRFWHRRSARLSASRSPLMLMVLALVSATVSGAGTDTRLLEAARRGDAKAVQELIARKVDVNLRQADGA